jgi:hypothetical protein
MPEVRFAGGKKGLLGVLLRGNRKEDRRLMLFVSYGRRLIAQVSRRVRLSSIPSSIHPTNERKGKLPSFLLA